jgi:hypothetical protein
MPKFTLNNPTDGTKKRGTGIRRDGKELHHQLYEKLCIFAPK